MSRLDQLAGEPLARLRFGLRLYGAAWGSFFVFMGIVEVFDTTSHDGTLGSLVMWGHGGQAYLLMLVAINLVIAVALYHSAKDPIRYRSAIDLALGINLAHLATMAVLALTEPHEHIHLLGDVPAGLLPTLALWALWLPVRSQSTERGDPRAMLSDRTISRFANWLGARGLRWTGRLNTPLYRASGGRLGGRVGRAPVLLLTTTGRRSGRSRTVPVVYLADGDRQVVINTNAGNAPVPAWSLNLLANPEAEVEIGRRRIEVRARVAEGDERADLWRRHNEQFAGFEFYETKLDREISVFILEPTIA